MKALLVLEDGFTLHGETFAGEGEVCGEVVFNTSMFGYQEIVTDPSYKGQIVALTYPLIGNYGINVQDNESAGFQAEALIIREYSPFPHNWRSRTTLQAFLAGRRAIGLEGIDTRALTKHIREAGAMKGIISTTDSDPVSLMFKARACPGLEGRDMVKYVTCQKEYIWQEEEGGGQGIGLGDRQYRVIALDLGIKYNILRMLRKVGCQVKVVPAFTKAEAILNDDPDGIFLSNGPGDPAGVPYVVEEVKKLLGKKPLFGICLGHQILGRALGLKTYKLKFGHRGANHPVKNLATSEIEITVQNHGFCVEMSGVGFNDLKRRKIETEDGIRFTHLNLNDNTLEGIEHLGLNCFSVQYHPEASPGPHDSWYLFEKFTKMMKLSKKR